MPVPISIRRNRSILAYLKIVIPVALFLVCTLLFYWEPHLELTFYNRSWVSQHILPTPPLSGCFNPNTVSPSYNLSDALYGARHTEIHTGISFGFGLDCYNFAGTVRSPDDPLGPLAGAGTPPANPPLSPDERRQFHTYWRVDLRPFGVNQEWLLKSF